MQTNYDLLNRKAWNNLIVIQSYTYADLKKIPTYHVNLKAML